MKPNLDTLEVSRLGLTHKQAHMHTYMGWNTTTVTKYQEW